MPPEPYSAISARQEHFSGAYVRAVCAATGCGCAKPEPDDDKIDFTLSSRVSGTIKTKPKIDIQVKCQMSGAAAGNAETISYSLDLETYDNLRDPLVVNPRYLVVVLVSNNIDEWIVQTENSLIYRHCAYWCSLKGLPASVNATSQTVHLRRVNIFTPAVLRQMMERASNGEDMP